MIAWFHSGGSPHGPGPQPGIWEVLIRIYDAALAATLILAGLAKGRGRLLLAASALSNLFVVYALYMLQLD
jgi:hypothetical protein